MITGENWLTVSKVVEDYPNSREVRRASGNKPQMKSCNYRGTKMKPLPLSCSCEVLVMQLGEKCITGWNQISHRSRNGLNIDRLEMKNDKRWITDKLTFGTWNVISINNKKNELIRLLKTPKVDVAFISEQKK